jgi:hypothetical protein
MKKILAITMSLLFVVSVFGIASAMAAVNPPPPPPEYCLTDYYTISSNSVKVGQTFTVSLSTTENWPYPNVKMGGQTIEYITGEIVTKGGLPYKIGPVELIQVEYYGAEGKLIYSGLVLPDCGFGFPCWSELNPGWGDVEWITWTFRAVTPGTLVVTNETCNDTETVTITAKDLPFKFFAKLFGFGKKD